MIFKNDTNKDNSVFSSIVANESFIDKNTTLSVIAYGFPDAPNELMIPNAEFELFDGSKTIGKGKVLEIINAQFVNENGTWSIKYQS
jgi:hypothetical protein